jgi:NAD(P)-dependent dehydrogenase (short-subunit alcohol dehydrogenase family)
MESTDGRISVVTGANRGIGRAIAAGLAARGGTVVLACRDPALAGAAVEAVRRQVGHDRLRAEALDVSDPACCSPASPPELAVGADQGAQGRLADAG